MAGLCDTCHAGCCRGHNHVITPYDAFRISFETARAIGDFVLFTVVTPEQRDRRFDPIHFSDPELAGKDCYLALKHTPSTALPGSHKCVFLEETSRAHTLPERGDHAGARVEARCSIYASRPLMCRTYPAALAPVGVALVFRPTGTADNAKHPAYSLCPEEWTEAGFGGDPQHLPHTLATKEYEEKFFNSAVSAWNREPGNTADFFPFMGKIYAARVRFGIGSGMGSSLQPFPATN